MQSTPWIRIVLFFTILYGVAQNSEKPIHYEMCEVVQFFSRTAWVASVIQRCDEIEEYNDMQNQNCLLVLSSQ